MDLLATRLVASKRLYVNGHDVIVIDLPSPILKVVSESTGMLPLLLEKKGGSGTRVE